VGAAIRAETEARVRELQRSALVALRVKAMRAQLQNQELVKTAVSSAQDVAARNAAAVAAAWAALSRAEANAEASLGVGAVLPPPSSSSSSSSMYTMPGPHAAANEHVNVARVRGEVFEEALAMLKVSDLIVTGGKKGSGGGGSGGGGGGAAKLAERVAKARASAATMDSQSVYERSELESSSNEAIERLNQIRPIVANLRVHMNALREANAETALDIEKRLVELSVAKRAAKRLELAIECNLPLSPMPVEAK
jgi:hypothetical protein